MQREIIPSSVCQWEPARSLQLGPAPQRARGLGRSLASTGPSMPSTPQDTPVALMALLGSFSPPNPACAPSQPAPAAGEAAPLAGGPFGVGADSTNTVVIQTPCHRGLSLVHFCGISSDFPAPHGQQPQKPPSPSSPTAHRAASPISELGWHRTPRPLPHGRSCSHRSGCCHGFPQENTAPPAPHRLNLVTAATRMTRRKATRRSHGNN